MLFCSVFIHWVTMLKHRFTLCMIKAAVFSIRKRRLKFICCVTREFSFWTAAIYIVALSTNNDFTAGKQYHYFLGVKSNDGDYVIDPDTSKNVKLSYAGATIFYSNKKKRYADTLQITGPTTAKLKIMVKITQVKYVSVWSVLNEKFKLEYKNILLAADSPFIREKLIFQHRTQLWCLPFVTSQRSACRIQVNCKANGKQKDSICWY